MAAIPVVALAIVLHPQSGALLVDEATDPRTNQLFHRPPGGSVEFLECSRDTVARELLEEYGLRIEVVDETSDVLENRFALDGERSHEIVLLRRARLCDADGARFDRLPCRDADGVSATWRDERHARIPLVPVGVQAIIEKMMSTP